MAELIGAAAREIQGQERAVGEPLVYPQAVWGQGSHREVRVVEKLQRSI